MDLSTQYMGLQLANPVIVASCSLVNSVEGVKRCADAGAGAVVLKSLFEEQVDTETEDLEQYLWLSGHAEAFEYVRKMGMALGPREYLTLVDEAKRAVSIPVIASLNCISPKWWVDYAKQVAAAGADALELNISVMPSDPSYTSEETERIYYRILEGVKGHISLPIAVKLGPYFTSLARVADELSRRGASALVLFNRFYRLDIHHDKLELATGYPFSTPDEMSLPLRWIGLLAGRINCDLAASTGVHDGDGVVKLLLVGATAVQICSTLYLNGLGRIGSMLEQVEAWMKAHRVSSLVEIRGKLSQMQSDRPALYERLQYIKALVGME